MSPANHEFQMRMFRGQRNFYISGYILLGLFIIYRLIILLKELAQKDELIEVSRNEIKMLNKKIDELKDNDKNPLQKRLSTTINTNGRKSLVNRTSTFNAK